MWVFPKLDSGAPSPNDATKKHGIAVGGWNYPRWVVCWANTENDWARGYVVHNVKPRFIARWGLTPVESEEAGTFGYGIRLGDQHLSLIGPDFFDPSDARRHSDTRELMIGAVVAVTAFIRNELEYAAALLASESPDEVFLRPPGVRERLRRRTTSPRRRRDT